MTIDERLERLTERHEALAQGVGLLQNSIREQGANIDKVVAAIQEDAENIRALARIAQIHERRITELEGGEDA